MNILMIGTDKTLLKKDSEVRQRMLDYGALVKELHIIVFSGKTDFKNENIANVFIYSTNSFNRWFYIFDAIRIGKKILTTNNKDLITAQDPFECGLVAYLLAKRYKIGFNVQEHGDFYSDNYWKKETFINWIRYYFGIFILKQANSIRVVSEKIAKTLVKKFRISKEKIVKVPVYVDFKISVKHSKSDEFKGRFVFLTMARLVKQKNLILLIKAFKKIAENFPNALLLIVGQGSEKDVLLELVKKQNLFDNVSFIDWTDNINYYYNNADAYVLSSNYEGWGRVIIEAASYSLPIVMTNVGCANEVIKDGESGLLVLIADKKELYQAMKSILKDNNLRNQLSLNVKKSLEILPNKEETLELYKKSWQLAIIDKKY